MCPRRGQTFTNSVLGGRANVFRHVSSLGEKQHFSVETGQILSLTAENESRRQGRGVPIPRHGRVAWTLCAQPGILFAFQAQNQQEFSHSRRRFHPMSNRPFGQGKHRQGYRMFESSCGRSCGSGFALYLSGKYCAGIIHD